MLLLKKMHHPVRCVVLNLEPRPVPEKTGKIGAFPGSAKKPLKLNRINLSGVKRCAL